MAHKKIALLAAFVAAGSALASPYVPMSYVPVSQEHAGVEPVVIVVPASELSRCLETLEQVFIAPVEDATVQSASLSAQVSGPAVTCVAE
ncbi:hypothetical protein [Celeribacter arenosi]|uniref:Uncharacterized protein n=1 Tax=Celeribacter arenosi TaxID=792649 RepID=A0ABP7JU21_9RHOB